MTRIGKFDNRLARDLPNSDLNFASQQSVGTNTSLAQTWATGLTSVLRFWSQSMNTAADLSLSITRSWTSTGGTVTHTPITTGVSFHVFALGYNY